MVGGSTRVFSLLGSPIDHSLSPAMYNAGFRALGLDAIYVPVRCVADDVGPLIRAVCRSGGGGNVTVPHKEIAAAAIARPSERLRAIGACNTFWGAEGEEAAGDNTDVDGVLAALQRLDAPATAWFVAGTGGAARAVVAAARERGAAVAIRSRDPARRHAFERWAANAGVALTAAAECEVLINATPLGLHAGDHLPIALDESPRAMVALDLVYARGETVWVRTLRQSGVRAADGRTMLVAQGAAAFRHWFPGEHPPTEVMRAAVDDALR